MARKCKTTSFDTDDDYERELLEFAETQGVYSRFVKRLIARYRDEQQAGTSVVPTQPIPKGLTEDSSSMRSKAAMFL